MQKYHLRFADEHWVLFKSGEEPGKLKWMNKSEAISDCRRLLKGLATEKEPISFEVHNKKGRIQTEYTYPRSADPRKSKG